MSAKRWACRAASMGGSPRPRNLVPSNLLFSGLGIGEADSLGPTALASASPVPPCKPGGARPTTPTDRITAMANTNVTAQMVKELRDKTGAGMMDCKAALADTDGDMETAVDWLRKKGLAKAAKKAGRI